jgi:hypothetical protein
MKKGMRERVSGGHEVNIKFSALKKIYPRVNNFGCSPHMKAIIV